MVRSRWPWFGLALNLRAASGIGPCRDKLWRLWTELAAGEKATASRASRTL